MKPAELGHSLDVNYKEDLKKWSQECLVTETAARMALSLGGKDCPG